MSVCIEFKCPRYEECKKTGGHAKEHQHNKFCDQGCVLLPYTNDGPGIQKHRCVGN